MGVVGSELDDETQLRLGASFLNNVGQKTKGKCWRVHLNINVTIHWVWAKTAKKILETVNQPETSFIRL